MYVYKLRIELPAGIEGVESEWMTFKKLGFANPINQGDFIHLRNINLGQATHIEHYHDGYDGSHSIVLVDTEEGVLRNVKKKEELDKNLKPLEDLIEFDF